MKMTSKPLIEVALVLTGQGFSPEDVTSMVRLKPTKTWHLGESVQKTKLTRKHDGWNFGLPQKESYELDPILCELLDAVEPYKTGIVEAVNRFGLKSEISFGVYIRGETPASCFSADSIRRVAALGAGLDIDLILSD